MVIYADEILLKNFFMSYLILIIVGEILVIKYKKRDLIIASAIVSLIALFSITYEINNILIRMLTIYIMTHVSFKPSKINILFIELSFILSVTFLIGGVLNSSINNSIEIIVCGITCVIAIKKYNEYYKRKKWKIRNRYKLEFQIENKDIELNAFLDTGNFLSTSFKDEPVIIISKEVIKDKVSDKIINLLMNGEIGDLSYSILKNLRPISYIVLNDKTKMAYGLKVEDIKIQNENNNIIRDAVIVLSENKIKESDAIIGISLLEGGIENGNTINVKAKSKEVIC